MNKTIARTLALVVTGGCLGALTTLLIREPMSPTPNVQIGKSAQNETPPALKVAATNDSDAISKLEATIERLRVELELSNLLLAELEAESKLLQDELAATTPRHAISETDGPLDAHRKARALLQQTMRRQGIADGAMFGAFYDNVSMLAKISQLGDEGVAALIELAFDESLAIEERESALEMLRFLPNTKALEVMLNPPEDLAIESGYSPEGSVEELARMAEWIEPSQLTPYRDELHRLAVNALNQGSANEALRMIGVLALVHDYPPSQQLLRNPTWHREYADFLLKMGHWVGNDAARTFIEDIARTHHNRYIRGSATDILASW